MKYSTRVTVLLTLLGLGIPVQAYKVKEPGDLEVHVTISDSPQFIHDWQTKPSGEPVTISRLEKMKIGDIAFIAFLVTGYTKNDEGHAQVNIDVIVRNPDGTAQFTLNDYSRVRAVPPDDSFVMADPALDYIAEPGDPLGEYRIEAVAHDVLTGKKAEGFSTFIVEPSPAVSNSCFGSVIELSTWMMNYYQDPTPHKLPCALTYFVESNLYEREGASQNFVHFFSASLEKNPHAMKELYDTLVQSGSVDARNMALHVFWMINTDESQRLFHLARKEWKTPSLDPIYERLSEEVPMNILDMPIDSPTILDSLWATFFATGDSQPVQRIASVIHLREDGHGAEMIIGGAARWSLTANANQHPRVREIVRHLASHEEDPTRSILEEILKKSEGAGSDDDS
jgi:hypothetical protein